ncbi:hypothetical protein ACHHYP_06867 [Achlya hypogyna]|uniref:Uncharacterized protein n=1 Tax=Achlya hypogyna TaxID=1202772 RepID=A0A1V9YRJ8_ACHHY|nr:hypothetical protein ACHHYP_06867 [Achlya hypogyna]
MAAQVKRALVALGCPNEVLIESPLHVHGSKRDLLIWLHERSRTFLGQTPSVPTSASEANSLLSRWLLQMGVESHDVCLRLLDGTLGVAKTNEILLNIVEQLEGFQTLEQHGADASVAQGGSLLDAICDHEVSA